MNDTDSIYDNEDFCVSVWHEYKMTNKTKKFWDEEMEKLRNIDKPFMTFKYLNTSNGITVEVLGSGGRIYHYD